MAYLRHCLEQLRRRQGDPHWRVIGASVDASRRLLCPEFPPAAEDAAYAPAPEAYLGPRHQLGAPARR